MLRMEVEPMAGPYCSSSAIEGRQMAAAFTGPGRISPHHRTVAPPRMGGDVAAAYYSVLQYT